MKLDRHNKLFLSVLWCTCVDHNRKYTSTNSVTTKDQMLFYFIFSNLEKLKLWMIVEAIIFIRSTPIQGEENIV